MRRLRDLSLGRRLGLAFVAVLLVAGVFAGAVLALLHVNGDLLADYSQRTVRQVRLARALERNVLETSIAFRTYLLDPTPENRDAYGRLALRATTIADDFERGLRDPQVAARFAEVKPLLARYVAETASAMATRDAGAQPQAAALREQVVLGVRALSLEQESAGERAIATVRANRMSIVRSVWIGGVLIALALAAIGVATTLAIRQPARRLAAVARRLQAGDWHPALALPRDAAGSRDEMRQLEAAIGAAAHELEQRERDLQERNARIQEQGEVIQAQNEELQAQNEELQAQNEEIQAQNEEIAAQAEELETQNDELRGQARRLREQSRALEEADARKNEFLGILAHELRNPLSPITNALELLRTLPADHAGSVRARSILDRQVRHLTRLVDDLLDVTRISHGKITLHRDAVDLREMLAEVLHDLQDHAQRRQVHLVDRMPDEPLTVHGDRTRLRQVFGNILGNALKFTPAGGTVTVEAASSGGAAHVSVVDDGPGMTPELLARLFQPFSQATPEPGKPQGGLGLGLALARALAALHGGDIVAASDGPGRGSRFTVRLPLADAGAAAHDGEALLSLAARAAEGMNAVK